jgi:leader peptidase (prepilin peptidase)/N-methyltransferase
MTLLLARVAATERRALIYHLAFWLAREGIVFGYNGGVSYVLIGAILAGLLAGYVINYLADVLPVTRRFSAPTCRSCQKPISWPDYILLRKCRTCVSRRSLRTYLVLVFSIAAGIVVWWHPFQRLDIWLVWLLAVFFGTVIVIDVEHRLILHPVSLAGAAIGLYTGIRLHGILATLLGGAAGFGIMLALYYLGGLFARWLARRRGQELEEEALGYGDVNLAGVLGLILGWPGIIAGLMAAILLGGLASLFYIVSLLVLRRFKPFSAIPYAPFLILGAVILLSRAG